MQIIATHINYFFVCHRKLWLFANGINMEHTSDIVYDGKLLHESSYPQRAARYTEISLQATTKDEIHLSGIIDFFDIKEKAIHEIKRSNKMEEAHEWQVKYYIWLLELNGISDAYGILEYPKLRTTSKIILSEKDREYLEKLVPEIAALQTNETCPEKITGKICKSCSYLDLCYAGD